MPASGSVKLSIAMTQTLAAGATRPESVAHPFRSTNDEYTYASGTAAGQIDKTAYKLINLAGAAQTIDLTTIVCSDGSTGFSAIRGIAIYNDATNVAHVLTIGNAASNPWSPFFAAGTVVETIQAKMPWLQGKPLGTTGHVVDSSNKNLKLDPGANTFDARLFIWGN